ncbi:RNA polymerase sigma-I factor [Cohnella cholangitidis]|uniref:RNA polymerase sigma factor SigI n=1 Tax=Cohnella cholangitidis TaxID=2598458 RepID=A0A7G5C2K1_9BACL|nr:RNA polymerase sigma-I factor [Cohnella cholangitidis]QMV43435.1 RNA polymerase sigma-I factor [Cohnella cholangitidis]
MLLVLFKKWLNLTGRETRASNEEVAPERLVELIQNGNDELRNELIRQYHPYLLKTTSRFFRRYIDPKRDDAYSVALAAFDEAITGFSAEGGRLFLGFAETVIKRRLIDYVRQENRHASTIPYSAFDTDTEETAGTINRIEVAQSMDAYRLERSADERKLEIAALSEELALYGVTFDDLVTSSPRHQDSRAVLLRMGRRLASEESMFRFLCDKKQLPIKELCQAEAVSRKTAERHRKYLIAVSLIAYGTYPFLQEYIGMDREGKGERS